MRSSPGLASDHLQDGALREVTLWTRALLLIGVVMLILGPAVLWSIWGLLLLGVGTLAYRVRDLRMLLAQGIVLIWAGLGHLLAVENRWNFAGIALTVLGILMLWRFRHYQRHFGISITGPQVPLGSTLHAAEVTQLAHTSFLTISPLLSYGLGVLALIALPLIFTLGVLIARSSLRISDLIASLLTVDVAFAALGLALGCGALSGAAPRRSLAIWGMVASAVVLVAFLALMVVALLIERL